MVRARLAGVWTQRIAIALVLAGVAVFALRVGSSSSQALNFRDPTIWLASDSTGEVVQANAATGEVTARVPIGAAGDDLAAVQVGPGAIVLNKTKGDVAKVDAVTQQAEKRAPVAGADAKANVIAAGTEVRVVTSQSVVPVDVATGVPGTPVPTGTFKSIALDRHGLLWGLEATGKLHAVGKEAREIPLPGPTRPFGLVDAGGSAYLVDGNGPGVDTLDGSSPPRVDRGGCLNGPLPPDAVLGGSADGDTHVVVAIDVLTGTVHYSDLVDNSCMNVVIKNAAGARFGTPVEAAGLIYVPVVSTGEVVVVRVSEGTVVSRYRVTGADRPFELVAKDGTVWFNDPAGSSAGVLGTDGIVRSVNKLDTGGTGSPAGGGKPGQATATPGNANAPSGQGEGGTSSAAPSGAQPSGATGSQPSGGENPSATVRVAGSAGGTPGENRDRSGLVADFTYTSRLVQIGETVTFTDASSGGPTAWTWEFGDGEFAIGPQARHAWKEAGGFTVTLRVENGQASSVASITIQVLGPNEKVKPKADFRYSASRVEVGQPITFTDTSIGNPTKLEWDFGDGNKATGATVSHSWNAAGTYAVTLTASNGLGSDTAAPVSVTVVSGVQAPTAIIEAGANTAPVGQRVAFTSKSTGNPTKVEWDFGDGTTLLGDSVAHAWTRAGTFSVTLKVSNSAGSNSASVSITITDEVLRPVARFTASATTIEEGQEVRFTSISINNPTRLDWDFGDGGSASGTSVVHAFSGAGKTYRVILTASNGAGSSSTSRQIIVVAQLPPPSAGFGMSPESPVTVNTKVTFTDASQNATSWSWDFGDGDTSTLRNPTHTFTRVDTFPVTLTVTDERGRKSTITRSVRVRPVAPVSDFTWSPSLPQVGVDVAFTDQSSGATTWSWSFGDGATSTERNPRHKFADQRNYDVTLTVSNGDQSVSRTRTIAVGAAPSVANFDFTPATGIKTDTTVQFNDRSTGGKPTSYQWDFNDGTTSTAASPTHLFSVSKVYNVTLTVSNGGAPSSKTLAVNVAPAGPSFNVLGTRRIAGEAIGFQNTTPGGPYTVTWDWDDGSPPGTGNTPTHEFVTPKTYHVTMTVATSGGGTPVTTDVTIYPKPVADFTFPASITVNQAVTFNSAPSTGGPFTSHTWTFSNGTGPTTGASVSHTFTSSGDWVVTLTVTNGGGASEPPAEKTIHVKPLPPGQADFTYAPVSGSPATVRFTSSTPGGPYTPSQLVWTFTNGTGPTTGATVDHTFTGDGPYTVTLTVTNESGTSTKSRQVSVATLSDANVNFTTSPLVLTTLIDVTFTLDSPIPAAAFDSISWTFGDGATGTGSSVNHRYAHSGPYDVTITVRNAWGTYSRKKTITIT